MSWMGWTFGQRMFPGLCRWWFSREPRARLDLSEEERMRLLRKAFEKDKAKIVRTGLSQRKNRGYRVLTNDLLFLSRRDRDQYI